MMAGLRKSSETGGDSVSAAGAVSRGSTGAAGSVIVLGKPFDKGRYTEERSANGRSAGSVSMERRFVG